MKLLKGVFMDSGKHFDAASIYVEDAVTMAQAQTYLAAIGSLTDAVLYKTELTSVQEGISDPTAAGPTPIRHRGSIEIQQKVNKINRTIGIPALLDTEIDDSDGGLMKVNQAGCAAALAAFCTLNGYNVADWKVMNSTVYARR